MRLAALTLSALALTATMSAQQPGSDTVSAPRPGSDEVVIPEPTNGVGFCAPFGCFTRIQQIFDASTFPSKIRIDALDLFNNFAQSAEGFVEPAHYQFFLSTTDASSATASADMDQNLGTHHPLVAEFTIADFNTFFTGALRIALTEPFVYDPRHGNLLLEIRKDQTANFGDGPIYVDGSTATPGITLVTDQFGAQPSLGMSIGFVGKLRGPFRH
jgi:hypothetical protein